jgi:hypothetical protein
MYILQTINMWVDGNFKGLVGQTPNMSKKGYVRKSRTQVGQTRKDKSI